MNLFPIPTKSLVTSNTFAS